MSVLRLTLCARTYRAISCIERLEITCCLPRGKHQLLPSVRTTGQASPGFGTHAVTFAQRSYNVY